MGVNWLFNRSGALPGVFHRGTKEYCLGRPLQQGVWVGHFLQEAYFGAE